jgi:hypothetical protein
VAVSPSSFPNPQGPFQLNVQLNALVDPVAYLIQTVSINSEMAYFSCINPLSSTYSTCDLDAQGRLLCDSYYAVILTNGSADHGVYGVNSLGYESALANGYTDLICSVYTTEDVNYVGCGSYGDRNSWYYVSNSPTITYDDTSDPPIDGSLALLIPAYD